MVRRREKSKSTPARQVFDRIKKSTIKWRETNDKIELNVLKDLLVELGSCSSAENDHLDDETTARLLSLYQATNSPQDNLLSHLLYNLDARGHISLATKFGPPVFGWNAANIYADQLKSGMWVMLSAKPTGEQCVACIDAQRLWYSGIRFPQNQPLYQDFGNVDQNNAQNESDYNLQFLLPLFAFITRETEVLDYKIFIERNCLAYTFCALSSAQSDVRSLAYTILWQVLHGLQEKIVPENSQSEEKTFAEKSRYVFLLKLLRDSLDKKCQRISTIHAHFLARVSKLFTHPEDPVFWPIANFLLCKPVLDLDNVPEFFKLFQSDSTEHHDRERRWILSLLADAMQTVTDYNVLENRGGLRLLWLHVASPLANEHDRALILRITKAAGCIGAKLRWDMCNRHNLVAFIAAFLSARTFSQWELGFLLDIVNTCVIPCLESCQSDDKGCVLSGISVRRLLLQIEALLSDQTLKNTVDSMRSKLNVL